MKLPFSLPSPLGMTREEIVTLLLSEEYGFLPPKPEEVFVTEVETDERFGGGKALLKTLRMTLKTENGPFSFPLYYAVPAAAYEGTAAPVPCIIHINFRPDVPDRYMPTEELLDNGYAVLSFGYEDVTSDDADFTNGLAGIIFKHGHNEGDCGKIALWAWTTLAVFEYALTLPELNKARISIAGHSRLGKTVLLAGSLEPRISCVFANASGTSGAALFRGNEREKLKILADVRPYWFTGNYQKYADREELLPFDQHFLLAANASHLVFLTSAESDEWSDCVSEYLSAIAAGEYFQAAGLDGLIHPDRLPKAGDLFIDGQIGYALRKGRHFLSRDDWKAFMTFEKNHA